MPNLLLLARPTSLRNSGEMKLNRPTRFNMLRQATSSPFTLAQELNHWLLLRNLTCCPGKHAGEEIHDTQDHPRSHEPGKRFRCLLLRIWYKTTMSLENLAAFQPAAAHMCVCCVCVCVHDCSWATEGPCLDSSNCKIDQITTDFPSCQSESRVICVRAGDVTVAQ